MFLINTENSEFIMLGSEKGSKVDRLEKGMYNLQVRGGGLAPTVISFARNLDYTKGVVINEGIFKEVRDSLNDFFTEEMVAARNSLDMKHKLGLMLNGDPGTGKTFLAGQLAEELCQKYDGVGILATQAQDYSDLIDGIRADDPNRLIILIIDEFEKTFRSYDTALLSFLSGAREKDNTIIIATVNDADDLPRFITDRPSRFEKVFEFSFKDDIVLASTAKSMIPDEYKDKINSEVLLENLKKHPKMSIDKMRHIIRDIIAAQIKLEKTGEIRTLTIKDIELSSKSSIGFSSETITDYVPTTFLTSSEIGGDKEIIRIEFEDPILA